MAAAYGRPSTTRTAWRACCWPVQASRSWSRAPPADAAGLLLSAIADPDPVVMMEPIRLYRAAKEVLPDQLEPVPLGQAAIRRAGQDVTLVAWGAMVPPALAAADELARGRHQRRSHRPAHALAAGLADAEDLGRKDRPPGRGARGAAHRRTGRRAGRQPGRALLLRPAQRRRVESLATTSCIRRNCSKTSTCPVAARIAEALRKTMDD